MFGYGRGVCDLGVIEDPRAFDCVSCRFRRCLPKVRETQQVKGLMVHSTDRRAFPDSLVPTLLTSLSSLLNGTRQPLWEVAAQVLGAVLGSKQFRKAVWKEEQCISG